MKLAEFMRQNSSTVLDTGSLLELVTRFSNVYKYKEKIKKYKRKKENDKSTRDVH